MYIPQNESLGENQTCQYLTSTVHLYTPSIRLGWFTLTTISSRNQKTPQSILMKLRERVLLGISSEKF